MRLVSVSEMIALEKKANESGLGYDQMMENAGQSLAEVILNRYGNYSEKRVLGLIGSGNNGGDTLIALTVLQKYGFRATAYYAKVRNEKELLRKRFVDSGGIEVDFREDTNFDQLRILSFNNKLILDGILGTGIKLPLKGDIPEILKIVKQSNRDARIVAVDCPSGVDCDTGEIAEEAIKADITVCMAAMKQGMLKNPAIGMMGEIIFGDIGLPKQLFAELRNKYQIAESEHIFSLLPERPADAYKGTFGTCMVIGGSTQFCGAPVLSAKAAYRIGAGLVQVAVPGAIYDAAAGKTLESTWLILPHNQGLISQNAASIILKNLAKTRSVLIGPGLGLGDETRAFLREFLKFDKSQNESELGFMGTTGNKNTFNFSQPHFVFDADALRILAEIKDWHKRITKPAVLTPHPGEMSALTGMEVREIQKDRINVSQNYAAKIGHVVVLKGAVTIVASPGGEITIIPIATSALSTAGSGDVLSGMITGLIAQGLSPYDAAIAGCWLHGMAGMFAEREHGQSASVVAADIIDQIPRVLNKKTVL